MPVWLKTWLVIVAIVGGGVLFFFSITFVGAVLLVVLIPYAVWAFLTNKRERQELLAGLKEGYTGIKQPPVPPETRPLTEKEKELLAATPVWVVWYEDQFHVGAERDSFGVGVCFSDEDARRFIARSGGKMLVPGWDGHEILGPENPLTTPLFGAQQAEIIGAILERLEGGSMDPIPMRI